MLSYAVLIDGGFVKRRLGSSVNPAGIDAIRLLLQHISSHHCLEGMRLHRVYYYDAKPLDGTETRPLDGSRVDFGRHPTVARFQKLQSELAREPFMSLRIGELSFNGWSVSGKALQKAKSSTIEIGTDDLAPNITQKGVDMRIGMDIAALTLKRQAQAIVLVTGDSDFVPAMKFARREGAQLFLVPLGHGIKESMREHSDFLLELSAVPPAIRGPQVIPQDTRPAPSDRSASPAHRPTW
jgi:uncharacterized LabA/DUF88 family protein